MTYLTNVRKIVFWKCGKSNKQLFNVFVLYCFFRLMKKSNVEFYTFSLLQSMFEIPGSLSSSHIEALRLKFDQTLTWLYYVWTRTTLIIYSPALFLGKTDKVWNQNCDISFWWYCINLYFFIYLLLYVLTWCLYYTLNDSGY